MLTSNTTIYFEIIDLSICHAHSLNRSNTQTHLKDCKSANCGITPDEYRGWGRFERRYAQAI